MKIRILVLSLAIGLIAAALPIRAQSSLTVIATTTILADVANQVSGGLIPVDSLLPPDTDTHAYQASVSDAARVADADLLLTVGIGYEQFLGGLLDTVGEAIPVIDVSNGIDLLAYGEADSACHAAEEATPEAEHTDEPDHEHEHGACDPHVWMNPLNVQVWADNIAAALGALDPANADAYQANADAYGAQLDTLDQELTALVAELPADRRILVTNHEFMAYFAQHYSFTIAATVLPGGTTGAEISPQALADVISLVQAEQVPAIFAEISANPELVQLIADESGAAVVTTLYSESLSDAAGDAPTYLDMMRFNTQTIVDALG